ncbi:unnamed protein product [Closterium sp. NIES-54]
MQAERSQSAAGSFRDIPPSAFPPACFSPSPPNPHWGAILLQTEQSESAAVAPKSSSPLGHSFISTPPLSNPLHPSPPHLPPHPHPHQGAILLQTERSESAAVASAAAAIFRRAYTQKQDLRVFQGLVRAYLRIPKLKEAIAAAREAVKAFPNSASALSLLGEVYLQHSDSRDKARKVFEAALRMDGRCGAAVTGLADAHTMDGRHAAAVDVLERHLAVDAADWIHVKLGFVHMAANRLPDALHHLQTALSINPTNENAKRGLNRIDRLLKVIPNLS